MNFIKFLFTKSFWINIGLIAIATVITVFITFQWLKSYTNHGEYITLNDLNGLSLSQTIDILKDKKLNYVVIDTNTYKKDLPHQTVINQDPLPLDKVKEGRTVYLYISTNKAPLVEIPFLKGKYSKDAGIMKLRNAKFKIGEVIFKPSDSEGDILGLMIDSVEVKEGDFAPEGTEIQLIVGGGLMGSKISTPCLIGKTLGEANFLLNNDLNLGLINYGSKPLSDTASAVIYNQKPNPYDAIRVGEPIDIFLIQELPYDVEKCNQDTLNITNNNENDKP